MKILVAVDGSPQSISALGSLTQRISWFRENAELTLLYSHPPLPYQRAVSWAGHEAVHAYYDEESDAALVEARKLLDAKSLTYQIEKRIGDPAAEIIDCAETGRFDLIVMGTHGHTALVNLVLGSVATKVLAGSKTPVLFLH